MKTLEHWVLRIADSDWTWIGFNWMRPAREQRIGFGYIPFSSLLSGLPGIVLMAVLVMLTGCNDRSDQQFQRKLAGTWTLEFTYPEGGDFKSVTRVSPNGSYTSRIVSSGFTNELEGTWRVENGILIDINTKHSNTNSPQLPRVAWRVKVVRLDEHEFVVTRDGTNDWGSPFEQVTFRRTDK